MSEIETFNKFCVTNHEEKVIFLRPVPQRITSEDALLLAAWLVASSYKSKAEFDDVYSAVIAT